MIRTQVQLTAAQLSALKTRASVEDVSVSELVRQAIDLLVATEALASPEQMRKRAAAVVGQFASTGHDGARLHDDYLAEAFQA